MALLERILVQLGVAKNVKELFEETPAEERERAGSPDVLVSRIWPEKPVPAAEEVRRWQAPFARKCTPRGEPEYEYEILHTGPENIRVQGGGEQIWADGVRLDGLLQDAKYIKKVEESPYVPESNCSPRGRLFVLEDVEKELRRYAAVIHDPMTPVWGLEIITNHPSAALFFLRRIEYPRPPGRVAVKP